MVAGVEGWSIAGLGRDDGLRAEVQGYVCSGFQVVRGGGQSLRERQIHGAANM